MKLILSLIVSLALHGLMILSLDQSHLEFLNNFAQKNKLNALKSRIYIQEVKTEIIEKTKPSSEKVSALPKKQPRKKTIVDDQTNQSRSGGEDSQMAAFLGEVREVIVKNKYKSRVATRLQLDGVVEVEFTLKAPNKIVDLKIKNSSGKMPLDESALETVRRVTNFPTIPNSLELNEIPISFKLKFE
ncbi:MAG: hypothetical protein CME62_00135 [Halobacteriovoraceae bacterium]|nr:hypothetical protein [Halobacteriovoraceae bacterium]|tara:strand:- start:10129 stop:10689 length:561 start_codon:yes stop_codon:yes gene_type:complete